LYFNLHISAQQTGRQKVLHRKVVVTYRYWHLYLFCIVVDIGTELWAGIAQSV
jgi:hypothetical protein